MVTYHPSRRASLWLAIPVVFSLVGSVATMAQSPRSPPERRDSERARLPVTIRVAPEYGSSAPSVEIAGVELVRAAHGPVVRVKLRNLVDEAVMGLHFEIHGSDPNSSGGATQVASFDRRPREPVIASLAERVVDLEAANFEPGDKLRLAAVLYQSGRGEGDAGEVEEMRATAVSPHYFTPAVPQPPEP